MTIPNKRVAVLSPVAWRTPPRQYGAWETVAGNITKQCSHFEPSTRFQCLKPIPARIAVKDKANDCGLFTPRVTVAREGANNGNSALAPPPGANSQPAPRNSEDARNAFDRLFKKS